MNLRHRAFSAARWTALAMVGKAGLQYLQLAVLARFLVPADFGLMALVSSLVLFSQVFSDAGVSMAIVHRQDITRRQLASLYWLNIGISVTLMMLIIIISPVVAVLYGEPRLQMLLVWVSASLVINAVSQQWRILAEKELHFDKLARVELGSALLGFFSATLFAVNGAGVYALVAGGLTSSLATTLFSWLLLRPRWIPFELVSWNTIRNFMGFGLYTMGNNLLNTFNTQVDILLGGRLLGTTSLGEYSVPRELSLRIGSLLNPVVTRVGFPVMSKSQGEKEKLRYVYLSTLRMTASVNFPIYLSMFLFAPEFIRFLLGPRWVFAEDLLRILAVWGMLRAVVNPTGSLIYSVGRADLAFKWNLALLFFITPAVFFGSHFGNVGLALALLTSQAITLVPAWAWLVRPLCGAGFSAYHAQLVVPLALAGIASLFAWLCVSPLHGAILRIGVGLTVGFLAYLWLSWKFNRQWFDAMRELAFR